MKSRLKRNIGSISIGLIACLCSFFLGVSAKKISNYTDVLSGTLSLTSVATAFLFASFALVPALTNSKFLKALVELKMDKKLLDRLLLTTLGYFTNSIFSILLLTFNDTDTSLLNRILLSLWLGLGVFSINETYKILRILLRALKYY
jgi:hypothetical protein